MLQPTERAILPETELVVDIKLCCIKRRHLYCRHCRCFISTPSTCITVLLVVISRLEALRATLCTHCQGLGWEHPSTYTAASTSTSYTSVSISTSYTSASTSTAARQGVGGWTTLTQNRHPLDYCHRAPGAAYSKVIDFIFGYQLLTGDVIVSTLLVILILIQAQQLCRQ